MSRKCSKGIQLYSVFYNTVLYRLKSTITDLNTFFNARIFCISKLWPSFILPHHLNKRKGANEKQIKKILVCKNSHRYGVWKNLCFRSFLSKSKPAPHNPCSNCPLSNRWYSWIETRHTSESMRLFRMEVNRINNLKKENKTKVELIF